MSEIPAPGETDAVVLGCRCDPGFNRQGEGTRLGLDERRVWFVAGDCELHRTWDVPTISSAPGWFSRLLSHLRGLS